MSVQKTQEGSTIYRWLVIFGLVLGILLAMVSIAEIVYHPLCYVLRRPPSFTFLCEGGAEPGSCVYEVTSPLRWGGDQQSRAQIIVSADYCSGHVAGPVHIEIQPAEGESTEVEGWEQFQASHGESRTVSLALEDLFAYSGVPHPDGVPGITASGAPKQARGQFDIRIMYADKVMASTTITVVNTPWLHCTYLADSVIRAGEPLTAYVTVMNFGGRSSFSVEGGLHEVFPADSDTVSSTLEVDSDGWHLGKTWPLLYYTPSDMTNLVDTIQTGQDSTVRLVLPGHLFKSRHVYILDTWAVKRLPYLSFPDGDWRSSKDSWRAADYGQFSVVVVLE